MAINTIILGIETSCDDTAASIVRNGQVLSNIVSTQSEHALFGGVVPELASRAHQRLIVPVVEQALRDAGISRNQLSAIAVTFGPGLAGSLLVGVSFAKSLAMALGIPVIGINHLDGHIASLMLSDPSPVAPYLCLIVSGGHTQIMHVRQDASRELLGKTRDDAAGEAFDKVAKILGLGFPGGPEIEKISLTGDPNYHRFPRTRLKGYDYSFSGIKTNLLYYLNSFKGDEREELLRKHLPDICASFQEAVIDMLAAPIESALDNLGLQNVGLVGGVSANKSLRDRFVQIAAIRGGVCAVPHIQYSMDNAAMIAVSGFDKFGRNQFSPLTLSAVPSLAFS
ncbi:MAG: tRNA (adenosine(37)-N6)-threonylcarbamoyltransferase complex transferase subunit TsaD [Bacteroidetes bacterium]|nr:MAG: tRNA (adenosine(37)-N6)-threonylcarbamoyltransferase complex transferase subunit TsaD [Bacteroidota bacterium]